MSRPARAGVGVGLAGPSLLAGAVGNLLEGVWGERRSLQRAARRGKRPMLERVLEAPAQTLALRAGGRVAARDVEAAIGAGLGEAATGLVIVINPDFDGDFAELAR